MTIATLLTWFACHFIADFPLFAHASPIAALALFVPHLIIDALKARYGVIKWLWFDQALHLLTIVLILLAHF